MRIRILIALAFLLTSCGSINFRIGNHNLSNSNSKIILNQSELNVKTYTTNHQVFANLDPMDFGLNHGNYIGIIIGCGTIIRIPGIIGCGDLI